MIGTKEIKKGQIESYTTADVADSVGKRYQTENQKTFNDATSSIQTQLNTKQTYLVKDSVPTSAITGTTSVTQIGSSILIPANTFSANDVLNLESFSFAKTGAFGVATLRFYTNTTDTLVGAKLLATGNEVSANRLGAKMSRSFEISDGLIKNRINGTTSSWSDNIASLTAGLSEAFNPAVANYFFTTIQLGVASDSVVRTQLLISK